MKFIKPNGTKIEINDNPESIAKARELGWKTAEELKAEAEAKAAAEKAAAEAAAKAEKERAEKEKAAEKVKAAA